MPPRRLPAVRLVATTHAEVAEAGLVRVVGRDTELGQLDATFDAAAANGPAGALVEGPPGIGKSTIWEAGVEAARQRGWLVLTARAVASESQLTLSVLADLLAPVSEAIIATLAAPQRRALDAALLRTEADDGDARVLEGRVLGTAVRNLFERLSVDRPVLLAVDDVQWADRASAAAISFAVRRLNGAPIALLLGRRTPLPMPLDLGEALSAGRWRSIAVGPMTLGSIHEVLAGRGRGAPSRATLVRLHQVSGGNPLFALEIARVLDVTGEPPAGEPLPVPADIRYLLRDRLAAEPIATRRVLLDLAVLGSATVARLASIEGREVTSDLERARSEGLVAVDGSSLGFTHPLYAAAAIAVAAPDERRSAHARIAATATGIEEEARHRALAIEGEDEAVAAALDAAASEARRRAAPLAAADLLRLSIERTPVARSDDVARRRIALANELVRAGDALAAVRELEAVIAGELRRERARARLMLAAIRFETEASTGAAAALARAALEDAAGNDELEAHVYAVLAAVDWDDLARQATYVEAAEERLARVANPDPVVEGLIVAVRCGADIVAGRQLDPELVARGLELELLAPAAAVADRFSASLGTWLKQLDRLDEARPWLEVTRTTAIEEGDEGSLPYALAHLPELELRTGNWARAEALAREHMTLAESSGLESQRDQALYNLALVHAHQGRVEAARAEIAAAIELSAAAGDEWMLSGVLPVLGFLELSVGAPRAAAEALERAYAIRTQLGGVAAWRPGPDLVEALLASGAVERAEVVQRELDERAARHERRAIRAGVGRSRGLALAARGRLDDAAAAVVSSIDGEAGPAMSFDRGRSLLALGQIRRRLRERGAARDAFESARTIFAALGARLWEERAAAELTRTGLRRGSRTELTEGERRVAELVASGMTNRQVAAALFMSPKTVDANLGRAYAKLGIRSRAELGAVIGRAAGGAQT